MVLQPLPPAQNVSTCLLPCLQADYIPYFSDFGEIFSRLRDAVALLANLNLHLTVFRLTLSEEGQAVLEKKHHHKHPHAMQIQNKLKHEQRKFKGLVII